MFVCVWLCVVVYACVFLRMEVYLVGVHVFVFFDTLTRVCVCHVWSRMLVFVCSCLYMLVCVGVCLCTLGFVCVGLHVCFACVYFCMAAYERVYLRMCVYVFLWLFMC